MDSHDVSMAAYRTLRKPCRHVKKLLCKYILQKKFVEFHPRLKFYVMLEINYIDPRGISPNIPDRLLQH